MGLKDDVSDASGGDQGGGQKQVNVGPPSSNTSVTNVSMVMTTLKTTSVSAELGKYVVTQIIWCQFAVQSN